MSTIEQLLVCACENLLNIIEVYDERIVEPAIKSTPHNLQFMYAQGYHAEFYKTLVMFMKYICHYRKKSMQRLEYIRLNYFFMIYTSPKGIYKIGDAVMHNNKLAHIVDYIYQLDLYEIKYIDASPLGETHGWFRDTDFHSTS